jgi:NADPH:quinone reductase-like Zn-dependent oxidoreductase
VTGLFEANLYCIKFKISSKSTNSNIVKMVLSTMKAMVIEVPENGSKPELVKKEISPPVLDHHEVLVKVATVAQNPTDVQAFDLNIFGNGAVLGCDFAGKVERLGKDVTKVAEGDTIAGLIWGGKLKHHGITRSGYLYDMHRRDQGPRGIQRVHQGP